LCGGKKGIAGDILGNFQLFEAKTFTKHGDDLAIFRSEQMRDQDLLFHDLTT
jgi:hypothetical protein